MDWKVVLRKLILWIGFTIGLLVLPILISVVICMMIGAKVSITLYTKEIIFIAVTLTASSLVDIYNLTRKGIKDLFTSGMLALLVLMSLFCVSLYTSVSICEAKGIEINKDLVNSIIVPLSIGSFIISGSCQFILARAEGGE